MATKKIPISFNDKDQEQLKELIDLLDYANVYGADPKAIKFSINFTLSALKNTEKVYSGLNRFDLDKYFKSVIKAEIVTRNNKIIEKMQKRVN